jgi:hypothetical protein
VHRKGRDTPPWPGQARPCWADRQAVADHRGHFLLELHDHHVLCSSVLCSSVHPHLKAGADGIDLVEPLLVTHGGQRADNVEKPHWLFLLPFH